MDLGFLDNFYRPIAAPLLVLMLALPVNTALHRCRPDWALTRRQLALILAMLLMASVLPGQELLRMLPFSAARSATGLRQPCS